MRVGCVVLSTAQGLGYLAKDFYDNGLVNEVLIHQHATMKSNPSWFGKAQVDLSVNSGWPYSKNLPEDERLKVYEFLSKIDIVLFFETYFNLEIVNIATSMKKKIIFFPMYEITPYPVYADAFCTVSDLDHQYYSKLYPKAKIKRINIPVPKEVSWKKRSRARVFIHNAGNGGTYGRNGTQELLSSLKFIESPIKLIIRSQKHKLHCNDPRVEITNGDVPFEELWQHGDVFVFPEKFNGLSLPIQEAYASGMAIMCGNRFPMNKWLPNELLIPTDGEEILNITNVKFKSSIFSEKTIAKCIDSWYNKDISSFSYMGKEWGEKNNWSALSEQYKEFFEEVLSG